MEISPILTVSGRMTGLDGAAGQNAGTDGWRYRRCAAVTGDRQATTRLVHVDSRPGMNCNYPDSLSADYVGGLGDVTRGLTLTAR